MVEIRAGTGGDEAVFLQEIYPECILNIVKARMENICSGYE
jgi:protein subunit release factor A